MTAALALLPSVLEAIPQVETGVEHLIAWVESVRSAAKQSAEWTPQMQASFDAALLARANNAEQQPDK